MEAALRVEREEDDAPVVLLAGGQLVDLLGEARAGPVRPHPVAPLTAGRLLIDSVESPLVVNAPKLCAALAALLRGRQFLQSGSILPSHKRSSSARDVWAAFERASCQRDEVCVNPQAY